MLTTISYPFLLLTAWPVLRVGLFGPPVPLVLGLTSVVLLLVWVCLTLLVAWRWTKMGPFSYPMASRAFLVILSTLIRTDDSVRMLVEGPTRPTRA